MSHPRTLRGVALLLFASLLLSGCGEEAGSDEAPDTNMSTSSGSEVPVGLACTEETAEVCSEEGLCASILPGGYCTLSCDVSCPEGSTCVDLNGFSFCKRDCDSRDDCRADEGYVCQNGVCDVGCTSDSVCPAGEVCDVGVCGPEPANRRLNAPCETSASCVDGFCLSAEFGGVCAEACGANDTCTMEMWGCSDGSTIEDPDTRQPLCIPGGGMVVQQAGVLTPTDPNDPSRYDFFIEDGVASFLIVAEGSSASGLMIIQNLTGPDGVYAGEINATGFTAPFRLSPSSGHSSAMVPNNADPDLQVASGNWSFQVASETQIRRVQLFTKSGVDINSATFDVNIYLPTGVLPGIDASNADQSNHLNTALSRMTSTFWQEHGLRLGAVRYFDIADSFNSITSRDELNTMFSGQSMGKTEGSLNVFFVRELQFQGGEAAGISGGLPGSVGVMGTGGSGVAIAIQDTATATGDDLSHELGHFLGLYHVTEQGGFAHDVIEDTPRCKADPQFTFNDPCQENIMFPFLLTGFISQGLSPTQGLILRLSPQAE